MASLHIIYDPHDKLSYNAEANKRLELKVAILPVDADAGLNAIRCTAEELARLLMEQLP